MLSDPPRADLGFEGLISDRKGEDDLLLSVIVPAYNEEARIDSLLTSLSLSLASLQSRHEVIVVDDGSSDQTSSRARAHEITFLQHERNRGKASAVQSGIAISRGKYVAVLDADLEYLPHDLLPMLRRAVPEQCCAVYGSRYKEPRNFRSGIASHFRILRGQEIGSWFANWVLTLLVVIMYRRFITDTLTGLKLYPGDFLRNQSLSSVGFEGDHEITAKLIRANLPIFEVPVQYEPRNRSEGKKIGPIDGFRAVMTYLREWK